jgi:hypothetical protein
MKSLFARLPFATGAARKRSLRHLVPTSPTPTIAALPGSASAANQPNNVKNMNLKRIGTALPLTAAAALVLGLLTTSPPAYGDTPVPAAPSNLTAKADGTTSVRLTWTNNAADQSGVVISRDGVESVDLQGATVSSYTWNGLSPGTKYAFYIASKIYGTPGDPTGYGNTQSAWVGPVYATTAGKPAPVQYGTPWNGYVYGGSSYSVSAAITVPHLNCPFLQPTGVGDSATAWVGLGGAVTASPLVQIGVLSRCGNLGIQLSYLVWEQIPPQSNLVAVLTKPASPGDTVDLSVDYLGGTSFFMYATDTNRLLGWNWDTTVNEAAEQGVPQSAEWIVEAFGSGLADFGTVKFDGASYTTGQAAGSTYADNGHALRYIAGTASQPDTRISDIGTGKNAGAFKVIYLQS